MTDLIMIGVGSAVLGFVGAYAVWVKVRVLRLQADMLDAQIQLRNKAKELKCQQDPAIREFDSLLQRISQVAPDVSIHQFITTLIWQSKENDSEFESKFVPVSHDKRVHELMEHMKAYVGDRCVQYLFNETLSGIALQILVSCIPRGSRKPVRTKAVESMSFTGLPLKTV